MVFKKNPSISPDVQAIHTARRKDFRQRMNRAARIKKVVKVTNTWRNLRWTMILLINGLFVLSMAIKLDFLQGSLSTSRLFGIPLTDPFAAFQVWLATLSVSSELLIGVLVVVGFYSLIGGRIFCSWVCPYNLLAEWGEMLHFWLRKNRKAQDHTFRPEIRYLFWAIFLGLSAWSGYSVFETISMMAIVNRAMIFGPGLALLLVVVVLAVEILYSRRFWCRYLCPTGLTYSMLGRFSLIKIRYTLDQCHHDGACRRVCQAPQALEITKAGRAPRIALRLSGDCTVCGRCVDICPTGSLSFSLPFFSGKKAKKPDAIH